MRTKIFLIVITGLLFTIDYSLAQNASPYAIEVKLDKKIIHPDSLNFPNGTSLLTILSVLPEMLERTQSDNLANYEIQIEDVSVEESKYLILTNIKTEDVKEIEIVESPISSFENNGQGGTINITLKDVSEKPSGYISSVFSNLNCISPIAYFGIKHKKTDFKFITSYEYYAPNVNSSYIYDEETNLEYKKNDNEHYIEQMARLYIKYTPTIKDIFTFCASENYDKSACEEYNVVEQDTSNIEQNKLSNLILRANTKYEHIFNNDSKLSCEINYNYLPGKKYIYSRNRTFDNNNKNHDLGGNIEYSIPFSKKVKLFGGANYNIAWKNDNTPNDDEHYYNTFETSGQTFYISPYMKLECSFGKFSLKTILDYQYYNYMVGSNMEENYNQERHDITGKIALGWQFNKNNHIRLVLDKKLKRPQLEQLYPYYTYSKSYDGYVVGNNYLRPITSHEIKLEYITDIKTKSNTTMIINSSISYIRVDDVIQNHEVAMIPYNYLTFDNNGNGDCFNGNIMFYLRKGIFTLSTSFNAYFDKDYYDGDKDYTSYYRFSIMPSVNFPNGWMALMDIDYNSSIKSQKKSLGACTSGRFSIGKSWKHWQVYGFISCDLSGKTLDITYNGSNKATRTLYYLAPTTVGISAKFNL